MKQQLLELIYTSSTNANNTIRSKALNDLKVFEKQYSCSYIFELLEILNDFNSLNDTVKKHLIIYCKNYFKSLKYIDITTLREKENNVNIKKIISLIVKFIKNIIIGSVVIDNNFLLKIQNTAKNTNLIKIKTIKNLLVSVNSQNNNEILKELLISIFLLLKLLYKEEKYLLISSVKDCLISAINTKYFFEINNINYNNHNEYNWIDLTAVFSLIDILMQIELGLSSEIQIILTYYELLYELFIIYMFSFYYDSSINFTKNSFKNINNQYSIEESIILKEIYYTKSTIVTLFSTFVNFNVDSFIQLDKVSLGNELNLIYCQCYDKLFIFNSKFIIMLLMILLIDYFENNTNEFYSIFKTLNSCDIDSKYNIECSLIDKLITLIHNYDIVTFNQNNNNINNNQNNLDYILLNINNLSIEFNILHALSVCSLIENFSKISYIVIESILYKQKKISNKLKTFSTNSMPKPSRTCGNRTKLNINEYKDDEYFNEKIPCNTTNNIYEDKSKVHKNYVDKKDISKYYLDNRYNKLDYNMEYKNPNYQYDMFTYSSSNSNNSSDYFSDENVRKKVKAEKKLMKEKKVKIDDSNKINDLTITCQKEEDLFVLINEINHDCLKRSITYYYSINSKLIYKLLAFLNNITINYESLIIEKLDNSYEERSIMKYVCTIIDYVNSIAGSNIYKSILKVNLNE